MRRLAIIAWMSFTVLLAACGGSADSIINEGKGNGTSGPAVATVTVSASAQSIAADGSTSATISAVVKDATNNLIKGATVTFASSAGSLAVTQGTTDANGLATATLTAGQAASGTNITVNATSGTVAGKVSVAVVSIQQTITLTTSLPKIPSDGSKSAVITALVRNASNQLVPGVTVNFVADSGGIAITQGVTDATGTATATLSAASDPTNRTINVTATAGTATATISVGVTGTTLSVVGQPSLVLNGQGSYTVSLLNSANTGISGQTVTLTSANGNTVSPATFVTDTTGEKTVTLTAVKSGSDTLTATALGLTASQQITVSGQSFQFSTPAASAVSTNVNLGVTQTLAVTWSINGTPQVGQVVSFAATRGTLSAATATTDANGTATVTINSAVSGTAIITATTPTVGTTPGVSTQTIIDFVATTPASIALEASPATILVNNGQSTITATVRDAQDNLVQFATVDFSTVGDTTGGTLSTPTGITNQFGQATTVYRASSSPSATNGVVVKASIANPSISQTTTLTVGGLSVGLSLGTGATLTEIDGANGSPVSFSVPYTVIAADAGGNPVANVPVTLTVHPLFYAKGTYYLGNSSWVQSAVSNNPPVPITVCPNEDNTEPAINNQPNPDDFNGVLDPGEDGCNASGLPWNGATLGANQACNANGNGNGKLDPGVIAVANPGTVTTGADGSANFTVNYPENYANWVTVELIASTTVSGTQSSSSATFVLPILAKYLTTTTSSPPGYPSPFGVALVCTNPN